MRHQFVHNFLFTLLLNSVVYCLFKLGTINKGEIFQLFKSSVVPDYFFIGVVLIWIILWIVCNINQLFQNLFTEFSSLLRGIYISIATFLLSVSIISFNDVDNWKNAFVPLLLLLVYLVLLLGGTLISFFSGLMIRVNSVIRKISIIILILFGSFIYLLISYYIKIVLTSGCT